MQREEVCSIDFLLNATSETSVSSDLMVSAVKSHLIRFSGLIVIVPLGAIFETSDYSTALRPKIILQMLVYNNQKREEELRY